MIFRHEDEKICFLQIGEKFSLPREIVTYLYRKKKEAEEIDSNKVRGLRGWMIKMDCFECNPAVYERFPSSDDLEIIMKQTYSTTFSSGVSVYGTIRGALLNQIEMIGEPNYLMKKTEVSWGWGAFFCATEKAPLKWKLEYLKKHYWNLESEINFDHFKLRKGTVHEIDWRIHIDENGNW